MAKAKKQTATPAEINDFKEIESVKAKTNIPTGPVKVKILRMIRASYGAFNSNDEVSIDSELATKLVTGGKAEYVN